MGHSKAFMLEDMHKRANDIMAALLKEKAKVRENQLDIPEDAGEIFKIDFIRPAYAWLKEVHEHEFQAYREIKLLLPEEIWERYEKWGGFEEHRECVLLKDATIQLRKRICSRERPDFFKKSKRSQAKARLKTANSSSAGK